MQRLSIIVQYNTPHHKHGFVCSGVKERKGIRDDGSVAVDCVVVVRIRLPWRRVRDIRLSASRRRARVTAIGRTAPRRSAQGRSHVQFERQRAITAIAESRFSWRAALAASVSAAQASFANAIHESKPRARSACIIRERARRINSRSEWRVSTIETHASYARALVMFAQRSRKRSITRRRLFFVLFFSRAISREETTARSSTHPGSQVTLSCEEASSRRATPPSSLYTCSLLIEHLSIPLGRRPTRGTRGRSCARSSS